MYMFLNIQKGYILLHLSTYLSFMEFFFMYIRALYQSRFSRETKSFCYRHLIKIHIYIKTYTKIFKEIAYMTLGLVNFEIFRTDKQAGSSGRIFIYQSRDKYPSSLGKLSFSLKAFKWLREIYPCDRG